MTVVRLTKLNFEYNKVKYNFDAQCSSDVTEMAPIRERTMAGSPQVTQAAWTVMVYSLFTGEKAT
jgi:hypothetical protein